MNAADDDEAGWQRWDAAADGESLPPDGDLRGPAVDPWPVCPVLPLGMHDGMCHFLDYRREYRALTPRQLGSRPELLALCGGNAEWLWLCFPRRATRKVGGELKSIVVGYAVLAACEWLLKACGEQPMFGPHIVIRKPGVWPGETGEPVAHCGDELFIDGVFRPAGLRTGNIIWPADPPVDRPSQSCGADVGKYIQGRMQDYWRFRHGGGAIMCLGTATSAMLGAWPRNCVPSRPPESGETPSPNGQRRYPWRPRLRALDQYPRLPSADRASTK
jgi:hypothetical protein